MRRVLLASLLSCLFMWTPVDAAVTGFDAGRIIDDGVMIDTSTMMANDIQSFLNAKVPVCDTWGTQPYGGTTRAQYAASRGVSTPFICLKDYTENGKTSSQIIFDIAQKYSINPQVLIVLLQKEQGLATDDWPWPMQYRSAAGYGCPDTAPCDSQYYGLTNQLDWAAKMFRAILNNSPTWYTPYVIGNNYIQFNPDSSCGGSIVNIQNRATQALYNYTPYQPNAAALAADWGTAQCGAYGNRNFYLYFTSWFGPTYAPTFAAQPVYQQVFSDSNRVLPLGWNSSTVTNKTIYATVVMKNIGNATWTRQGALGITDVRLATSSPWGRSSSFCDSAVWIIPCSRPASLKENSVPPGSFGTFEFSLKAPSTPGHYSETFSPVVDGRAVFVSGEMVFQIDVHPEVFSAQSVWQQVYTDRTKTIPLGWNANLVAGSEAHLVVAMKNTGNTTWTKSGGFMISDTRLATYGPWGRNSIFCNNNWLINCARPTALNEDSVAPGQVGTFEFDIKIPNQPGQYSESFAPIIDGRTVFSSGAMTFNITVQPAIFSAQSVWQQAYADSTMTTPVGWNPVINRNQSVYAIVAMKNTGNTTWTKSGGFMISDTRLATYGPWGRNSIFCNNNWLINCARPTALNEDSVAPGQVGTFNFVLRAPSQPGQYSESFAPIIDGRTVFSSGAMTFNITVN